MSARVTLNEHAGPQAGSPSARTREIASIRRDAGVGHVQARHALPFRASGSAMSGRISTVLPWTNNGPN